MKSPNWSQLLRGFFPSWKFFDVAGTEFRLEVQRGQSKEELGPWENCLPQISRSVLNFPLNSRGNFLHACHNHLSHLNADIIESENSADLESRTSFQIACNLIEYLLRDEFGKETARFYRFRLLVETRGNVAEEALVSDIREAQL